MPLAEAQSRFHRVFQSFIGAVAQEGRPLVLFLDDLQWADAASLLLMRFLLCHPDTRHLLLRQIVLAHGGSIQVKSAPGQGATFIVELPRRPPT